MGRPRLGVVYDQGAAGPVEILRSLADIADVVLLVPDSEHIRRMAPLLASLAGEVRPIARDTVTADLPALDGVVTFSERCLRLTAEITEFLGLPGHSLDTAAALTDKSRQRQVLEPIDPVASVTVRSADDIAAALSEVGLPAVIKPVRGEGSAFTTRVDTAAEAMAAAHAAWQAAADQTLAVETYLTGIESGPIGDYVSVEVASVDGRHHVIAVTGKFPLAMPFRERGQFWPATLSEAESVAVRRLAGRALEALGVHSGLSHTEIKLSPDGPRLIEVNGRLGGYIQELALRSSGLDLIAQAGRIALGLAGPPPSADLERLHYQRYHLAPRAATQFLGIEGVAAVRQLAFVDAYRVLMPAGSRLRGDQSTQLLDLLCGESATHDDMLAEVGHAESLLTFSFRGRDGDTYRVAGGAVDTEANLDRGR